MDFELAEEGSFEKLFDTFVKLHQARWRDKDQPGVFCDPEVISFHREASRRFLEEGMLRLWRMRVDGEDAAALYGFLWRARFYAYLQGFEPRFAAKRVGSLLLLHAIERARRESCVEFDFLRGAEPYKLLWGPQWRTNYVLKLRAVDEGDESRDCCA